MSDAKPAPLVVNGWAIFAHPLFLDQIEALARQVAALKQRDPEARSTVDRLQALASGL